MSSSTISRSMSDLKYLSASVKFIVILKLMDLAISTNVVYCSQNSSHNLSNNQEVNNLTSIDSQTITRLNEIRLGPRARCSMAKDELDKCSAQLIALGQTSSYPDNSDELESVYCPNFRKIVNCINESSQCFRPFERQIIS